MLRIGGVTRPPRSAHGGFTADGAVSSFVEASDGVRLHLLSWPADARAVVVFLHGIASHGGWFGETATLLARERLAVYAPDRRGSGRSGGPPGHLADYHRALDDVELVLRLAAADHPGVPMFLAGSSWAAKLAIVYAALRPARLSGLLLLGPGLLPRVSLNAPRRAAVVAGHLAVPRLTVRIPLRPEMYTANPSYVDFVRADPLRLLTATAQFFWTTAVLDRRRAAASARLRLPVLLLQGDADAMMDVPATRRWFDELPAADTTYRAYPGAGHTLDFEPEPNRGRYLSDLRDWLSGHASGGP
jgi:alpha-beta hydrolase superfamily lysophospholipase